MLTFSLYAKMKKVILSIRVLPSKQGLIFFILGNIKYDDYGDGCHFKFEFRSFISLSFRESASGLKMEGELTSVVVWGVGWRQDATHS